MGKTEEFVGRGDPSVFFIFFSEIGGKGKGGGVVIHFCAAAAATARRVPSRFE